MAARFPYTKEQLIAALQARAKELGKCPVKKDMPEEMKPYFKLTFGKWCYALEAAGLRIPSRTTLERRNRRKQRHSHRKKAPEAAKQAQEAPETGGMGSNYHTPPKMRQKP